MEKYLRSVREFFCYLDGRPVTKDTVMAWKKHLQREENYSPSTVNASLAALNYLFNFLGWTSAAYFGRPGGSWTEQTMKS